jgi:nucleoside 2-deoxyribosyltransferase
MNRLYFAAPLFSAAELEFNERLAVKLSRSFSVFLPQRDGGLLTDLIKSGLPAGQAKRLERDIDAIISADVVLAILDGRSVDEGVAVELGVAYAYGKVCWALKTDVRTLAWFGDNPMIEVIISKLFTSVQELTDFAEKIYLQDTMPLPVR